MSSHSIPICFLLCLAFQCVPALCQIQSRAEASVDDNDAFEDTRTLRQGWTSSPNTRGTIDIIWSCAFTMGLSSWSMLCLNLPEPGESKARVLYRRALLTAMALIGPEFMFQFAYGQYLSARRSVQQFQAAGYGKWSMTHAFFADAGGFVLHPKDWVAFPVDAQQLFYLVDKGYIRYPDIERSQIKDKNKVDGLLRLITLLQITSFVFTVSARAVQGLAITLGELTTAAFIICSVGTYLCWIHKPADITVPEIIEMDVGIAEILVKAGDQARKPYNRTPLDFVSRKEWAGTLYPTHWFNVLRHFRIPMFQVLVKKKPNQRLENSLYPEIPDLKMLVVYAVAVPYNAVYISAWNYSFPTATEMLIWRVVTLTILSMVPIYGIVNYVAFTFWPAHRNQLKFWVRPSDERSTPSCSCEMPRGPEKIRRSHGFRARLERFAASLRNNSVSKDPELDVPLKALVPFYILAFTYCHCRAFIFLLDLVELRSLPKSAYVTVKWAELIPHL